jgi:hypothetical protein
MQWQKGILSIVVENAALATRLRFLNEELLSRLAKQPLFKGIQSIQYRVRPKDHPSNLKPHWQPTIPGPDVLEMLTATAMGIQEIPLRQALLQLVASFSKAE